MQCAIDDAVLSVRPILLFDVHVTKAFEENTGVAAKRVREYSKERPPRGLRKSSIPDQTCRALF